MESWFVLGGRQFPSRGKRLWRQRSTLYIYYLKQAATRRSWPFALSHWLPPLSSLWPALHKPAKHVFIKNSEQSWETKLGFWETEEPWNEADLLHKSTLEDPLGAAEAINSEALHPERRLPSVPLYDALLIWWFLLIQWRVFCCFLAANYPNFSMQEHSRMAGS